MDQLIVIVIGCLSKCGGIKSNVEEIKGKFDSAAYDDFLRNMSGRWVMIFSPEFFLQDNFPVRLAPRIDSWFSENEAFNVIR